MAFQPFRKKERWLRLAADLRETSLALVRPQCGGLGMWSIRNVVHPQCGPLWIRDALRVSPFIVVMKRVPGTET